MFRYFKPEDTNPVLRLNNFNQTERNMNIRVLSHRLRVMSFREIAYRFSVRLTDSLNAAVTARRSSNYADPVFLDFLLSTPVQFEPPVNPDDPLYHSSVKLAENALDGRMKVFSREINFESIPQWLTDPFLGKRADRLKRVPSWGERYRKTGLDIRAIWELNRLQVLVDISRAWLVTGRDEFASLAVHWVENWDERNPYARTVNWSSALEVSLRSIALLLAVNGLRNSDICTGNDNFKSCVSRLLYCHGKYIESHLSPRSSGFNHLAGEAAGLALLGNFLPEFPMAQKWRTKGLEILKKCIVELILPDGGGLEGSLGYLEFVCRIVSVVTLLYRRSLDELFGSRCREKLVKAGEFIAEVTDQGRQVSEFGDCDDAWIPGSLSFDRKERYSSVLNLLSMITGNDLISYGCAPDPDSLWLGGKEKVEQLSKKSDGTIRNGLTCFKDSGHYGSYPWPGAFLRFECGHWGDGRIWAHAHADRLSFSFFLDGSPVFVDPGTGYYLEDSNMRDFLRSSRAHNTVSVDGNSQGNALGTFFWESDIESELIEASENEGDIFLSGWVKDWRHEEKSNPLIHRRALRISKDKKEIAIEDAVETGKPREVEVTFTLHPDCEATGIDGQVEITYDGGKKILLIPDQNCTINLYRAETNPFRGWYSPSFYWVEPCWQVVCSRVVDGDTNINTVIKIEN